MKARATHAANPRRSQLGNMFRQTGRSIRTRLIACFVVIVLLMIAADVVAVWQFRQIAGAGERLGKLNDTSLAVVRVHFDVATFRDRVDALASNHDTRQFANEAAHIRQKFVQHVDYTEQMIRQTLDIQTTAPISSALESLRVTLLSQLDTAVELASVGEWDPVRLRLATQIPALIAFSSSLVDRVDQQVLQQRVRAMADTQHARRRLVTIVPVAGLLTLFAAAILGWYITRSITTPLCHLIAAAEALAHRDFRHHVNVHGDDELALLGNAFNYAARELQQLYEDLRRKEQELRDVINTVPAHVWRASPDGAVDFMNDRLQEFLGFPPEDILGWNWRSLLHPDDRAGFVSQWRTAVKDGQSMQSEVRLRRADGNYSWFCVQNVPLRDQAGNVSKWYGSGIEIQDRKRAEQERERLRQLEADLAHMNRVSMMGELAASLAHEIKQPIAATGTNARTGLRWLQREPPEIQEACEALLRIAKDIDRAAEIIDRNRSLYRRDTTEKEDVDLNELIREMKVLLEDKARQHSISIRTEMDGTVSPITADRVQVQQVLMNLMLNGIEAMKDSGELTITSKAAAGGEIVVSVSDLGVGLPVEHGERIFDAFFTTKKQGTGMGLSISRRIVESHGGRLWATRNRCGGATFHFMLPRDATAFSRPVA